MFQYRPVYGAQLVQILAPVCCVGTCVVFTCLRTQMNDLRLSCSSEMSFTWTGGVGGGDTSLMRGFIWSCSTADYTDEGRSSPGQGGRRWRRCPSLHEVNEHHLGCTQVPAGHIRHKRLVEAAAPDSSCHCALSSPSLPPAPCDLMSCICLFVSARST